MTGALRHIFALIGTGFVLVCCTKVQTPSEQQEGWIDLIPEVYIEGQPSTKSAITIAPNPMVMSLTLTEPGQYTDFSVPEYTNMQTTRRLVGWEFYYNNTSRARLSVKKGYGTDVFAHYPYVAMPREDFSLYHIPYKAGDVDYMVADKVAISSTETQNDKPINLNFHHIYTCISINIRFELTAYVKVNSVRIENISGNSDYDFNVEGTFSDMWYNTELLSRATRWDSKIQVNYSNVYVSASAAGTYGAPLDIMFPPFSANHPGPVYSPPGHRVNAFVPANYDLVVDLDGREVRHNMANDFKGLSSVELLRGRRYNLYYKFQNYLMIGVPEKATEGDWNDDANQHDIWI